MFAFYVRKPQRQAFSSLGPFIFVTEDCSFVYMYQQYAFNNTDATAKTHGWIWLKNHFSFMIFQGPPAPLWIRT